MPPIASEKEILDGLCHRVGPSVVLIFRYRDNTFVDFGAGSIIFSDHNQVLVSAHESIVHDGESLKIRFCDGERKNATLFYRSTQSMHAVLKTNSRSHHACVRFSKNSVRRQNIFTMAAVEAKDGVGLMSGTVSIPRCRAVRPNGTIVQGSVNLFAISCPLSGPKVPKDTEGLRLVGAAVFDMKGLVIGTIDRVDSCSPDIKYARKTSSFLNNLERSLKEIDATISLSKGEQGAFTEGTGTSRQGETSAASRSKKRGRDDPASGGTSTKKVNVEVAGEENSRLHMFPLQGGTSTDYWGRREAVRRELVRLVTRESDVLRTCTPSSREMRLSDQDYMELDINVPSMISHLDDVPRSASPLLENRASSAQQVVIASGLSQAGAQASRVKVEKARKNQQNEFNSCHLQPCSNVPSRLL